MLKISSIIDVTMMIYHIFICNTLYKQSHVKVHVTWDLDEYLV